MVAVQSVQTTPWAIIASVAGVLSLTITKPTGLSAGDLMIAHIASDGLGTDWGRSGWTKFMDQQNGTAIAIRSSLLWKIASAGDAAAANFTFTANPGGGSSAIAGAMMRITGHHPSSPIDTSNYATISNTNNPLFGNSITPSVTNCMIVLVASAVQRSGGVSGYNITTSPPTFTERWDQATTLSDDYTMSLATGVRPETSATGSSSVVAANVASDWVGQLFAIRPTPTNYPITAAQGSYALSGQTAALRKGFAALIATVGSYALSGIATLFTATKKYSQEGLNSNSYTKEGLPDTTYTKEPLP